MSFLDCLHPCTFTCSEASYSLLKILSCSAMGCAFLLRSQRCVRRENFKSLFHKCETQREGFFRLPTLVLTSNNKARIYLWFSSWNVTDFCGLASLKSMYTVWGSGRQGNLIVSILGELGKDDMKATSLSTESIYIFLNTSSPLSWGEILQGTDYDWNWTVKEALCLATTPIQTLLPAIHHLLELNSKIQLPTRNTGHRQHNEGY